LELSPVLPLVLYTGAGPWENNRTLHDLLGEPAEFHGFVPQWGPLFWELGRQSAEGLLASGDEWQQALAVLRAQGERGPGFERVYVEAMRRLEGLAGQDHVRWCELMRIILSWAQWRRPREEREALRAAGQAALVDATRQREVVDMGQTIAEAIWEESRLKGRSEGESQGGLRAARRMLRQLLTTRFGTVPDEVVQRIETCTDLDHLMAAAQQILSLDKPEDL
jgi:hypothetical protein